MKPLRSLLKILPRVKLDEPLAVHCTMRVGGPAAAMAFPEDPGQLRNLIEHLHRDGVPFKVVGKGANLLVSDAGYPGVIIILGPGFDRLERFDGELVQAGAGLSMARFSWQLARMGIAGFEFAAQIPGTVGGGVVNNAGAFEQDFTDRLVDATLIRSDGDEVTLPATELGLCYRSSRLKGSTGVVLVSARFRGERRESREIVSRIEEYGRIRGVNQPVNQFSSGCVFKNPGTHSAGYLIDVAGLKGTRVGDACVSPKHANFIVNEGRATAQNVLDLIHRIQDRVLDSQDVRLETEVEILGGALPRAA